MARLSLHLLGTFWVGLAGEPLTAFGYDKVRALLAYLAVEADRTHRREAMSLCHLQRLQGSQAKREAAWDTLREIYGWFSEGFETADLRDAKALLEELSSSPSV